MTPHDPILRADRYEESFAAQALRSARNRDELTAAWWSEADHFEGAARERLQDIYSEMLARFVPVGAG